MLTNSYFYYELHGYLAREIDHVTGKHTVYYYGSEGSPSGNMTQRTSYILNADGTKTDEQTVNYQYRDANWKDKLTNYNGTEISYDEIGNPLNWRGDMSFTWQNGRQLATASANGKNLSFAYDANGVRRQKTVDGTATDFYLNGDKIMAQKTGDTRLDFLYDDASDLLGFRYNGQSYYYVRNGQGDITSIIDNDGTEIVSYTYDSWGAPLSITGTQAETIGQLNPFRYRGYYYDDDTGLYYLNSRYYDPEVGRFLNADKAIADVGGNVNGYNLFAYAFNNPVNMIDENGNWPKWVKNAASAVSKAVKKAVNAVTSFVSGIFNKSNVNSPKTNKNKLPTTGKPNSKVEAPNGNQREYGSDGRAKKDTDYSHPQRHPDLNNPHYHDWDWTQPAGKERGGPYNIDVNAIVLGVGLVTVAAVATIWVVGNDITGVGAVDDWTLPVLGAAFSKGTILIFGG